MNIDLMSKALVLSVIILFIGIGFTSVTAIKSDISETKIEPGISSSGRYVYYNCYIRTNISSLGIAMLFPGYITSTYKCILKNW